MKALLALASLVAAGLGLSYSAPTTPPAPGTARTAAAETYEVDPVHSSVLFRVKHLGVSYFHGRFNDVSGTIVFDDSKPSDCSVEITVEADSVDTNAPDRERHLKSGDFLSASEFPLITFKSTKIKKKKGDVYEVTGDFELHGVKREITVEAQLVGKGDTPMGARMGFEIQFEIEPKDYEIRFMAQRPGALGPGLRITLGIEAIKQG